MRYSNTALKELRARYGKILRKCAYLNMALLVATIVATPAMAETTTETITGKLEKQDVVLDGADAQIYSVQPGSEFTLTNAQISNTTTINKSGSVINAAQITDDKTTLIKIENSSFIGNNATAGTGPNDWAIGGVIKTNPSTIGEYATTLEISGSEFTDNHAAHDGGAIGSYSGLKISGTESSKTTFTGNTANLRQDDKGEWSIVVDDESIGGGAISLGAVSSTGIASISNTIFENNMSGKNAGAIGTRLGKHGDNSSATLDISATFKNNKAFENGGAIYNTFYKNNGLGKGDGVTVTGEFIENQAGGHGGAIYNDGAVDNRGNGNAGGVMTVYDAEFTGNKALAGEAGAIYNSGTLNINAVDKKVVFTNNQALSTTYADPAGGAIFNKGTLNVVGTEDLKVVFENNKASIGGAISDSSKAIKTTISNAEFNNNRATADGGALSVYGTADISNTTFTGNTAAKSVDGLTASAVSDGGGAVMLGQHSQTTMDNVIFENNESAARGGAISARHIAESGGSLSISNSKFYTNKAGNFGGGIANVFKATVDFDTVDFDGNNATKAGGAIYNGKDANYASSTTPSMSTNNGTINLAGTNNFTNNTAGEKGAAIYNDEGGTVNLSGINVFSGNKLTDGTLNDIYNLGTMNVSGQLTLDGGILNDAVNGVINFAADTKLTAKLNTTTILANTVDIAEGASLNLIIDGMVDEKTYDFIKADNLTGSFAKNGENALYDWTWNNGSVDVVKKATNEVVENIIQQTGASEKDVNAAVAITSGTSSNASFNTLSNEISTMLQSSDTAVVAAGVKAAAAMAPTEVPIQQTQATQAATQVLAAFSGRLSGGSTAGIGESSGDFNAGHGAVWAKGLYNRSKLSGDEGFHSYSNGLALGTETQLTDSVKVGVGYAYAHSDVKPNTSKTEIDSNSAIVYAEYKPNNWYVNGIASYTWGRYDETKYSLSNIDSKYNVNSIAVQAMTGYDLHFNGLTLTHEAGLRYMNINQKAHADSIGNSISGNKSDIFTGVLGAKAVFDWQVSNSVALKPELRAALTYDLARDKAAAVMTLANGSVISAQGEALERVGGEFAAGFTTEIADNLELGLFWEGKFRKHYTDNTGTINVKYHF